jgi:hypothetical protein
MKHLKGYKDYLNENYLLSIFNLAMSSDSYWTFYLHNHKLLVAKVTQNYTYDVELTDKDSVSQTIPKTQIKALHSEELNPSVQKRVKSDPKVKKLNLKPIITARPRHHIKNKSLYVLMKEKQVMFFTLLEGDVIRGLIAAFTRYDITVHLKGGIPVTLLRHSVYDLRDKKGRCYLKAFQETHKDWKKSTLYTDIVE